MLLAPSDVSQEIVNFVVLTGTGVAAGLAYLWKQHEKKKEAKEDSPVVAVAGMLTNGRFIERLADQLMHNERTMRDGERATIELCHSVTRLRETIEDMRGQSDSVGIEKLLIAIANRETTPMTTPPMEVITAAQASQRKWHVPAAVTIAQWALESGWGARMPAGSNNPFGIKARAGDPSVTIPTHEVVNGKRILVNAAFRKFKDLTEAFDAHGQLLATAGAYAGARAHAGDPDKFADALTGHYATDPNYGTLLKSIMRGGNFYRYGAL